MTTEQWVVCSPGDPTEEQWSALYLLAEEDSRGDTSACMVSYNLTTKETRGDVYSSADGQSIVYVIAPDGAYTKTEEA